MGARDEMRLRRSLTGVEQLGSSSRQPDIDCRPLGFGETAVGTDRPSLEQGNRTRGAVQLLAAIPATPTNPGGGARLA